MKIVLGLKSGSLKELEYVIEILADNYYTVELDYATKENNIFIYNLYATKLIGNIKELEYGLSTINKFLNLEKEKGEILIHVTISKKEKEVYNYHYHSDNIKEISILDLIK